MKYSYDLIPAFFFFFKELLKACNKDVKAGASFGFKIFYYFLNLREKATEITK